MQYKKTYVYSYHRKGCGVPCYARKTVYTNKPKKNRNDGFWVDCLAAMLFGSGKSRRY